MSERDYIEEFKNIQVEFLQFIESEENVEDNFQNLKQLFEESRILNCPHDLRLFLHLLLKVANNHNRGPNFFSKIDQVLQYFKDDIKKYSNTEIFNIFKSNKRILLFLIENKIMTVDEYFVKQIIKEKYLEKKYPQYFAPEIKPFLNKKNFTKLDEKVNKLVEEINQELPDDFYELRKNGENESFICKLIREDAVEDFIIHINRNNISRNSTINPSIFETNSFLNKKKIQSNVSLIQYAAFYGSIQIFNFLKNENANLTPSLWLDVIHSKNAELIHFLEENHIEPSENVEKEPYIECFNESIKCHHIDFANYFLDNYLQNNYENSNDRNSQSLKNYNFSFLQNEQINESSLCYLCQYDYYALIKVFLTKIDIDINNKIIQNHIFKWNSKSYYSMKL